MPENRVSDERLNHVVGRLTDYCKWLSNGNQSPAPEGIEPEAVEQLSLLTELQNYRAVIKGVEKSLKAGSHIQMSSFDEHHFWCGIADRHNPTDDNFGDTIIDALAELVKAGSAG